MDTRDQRYGPAFPAPRSPLPKIKICGLCREEDADCVNEARPDYAGFVFAESRRRVTPAQAAALSARLSPGVIPVGVFVNAAVEEITALYRDGVIRAAQLHGNEDAAYIARLREAACSAGLGDALIVIKALTGPALSLALESGDTGCSNADYFLLDSGAGSGRRFDWAALEAAAPRLEKPWFLAGGVNITNIDEALALKPFGIDVSSGVETGGVKDRAKIRALVNAIRRGAW